MKEMLQKTVLKGSHSDLLLLFLSVIHITDWRDRALHVAHDCQDTR